MQGTTVSYRVPKSTEVKGTKMFGLTKKTWIIGGVVVALLGTSAWAAKWHNNSPEERAAFATSRISERLNLNDSQKAAFEKVAAAYVDIRGSRPEFMVSLSGKLKELAKDETLTVDEVNTLKEQIKAEFDKHADAIIPEFVTFYNTLDTTQRDMVAARLETMSERMGRGERGHHGWGKRGERNAQ